MTPGTRDAHRRFCETEGWDVVRSATGAAVRHHLTFELLLPDGSRLRTRISRPVDRSAYGPSLWSHILRDQLQVSEQEFWACVNDKILPSRGQGRAPKVGVPAGMVFALRRDLHLSDNEIAGLDRAEAAALLAKHWSGEG